MPRTAFGTLGGPPSVSNSGVGRRTARPAVPSSARIAPTTKMIPRVHRIGIWTGAGAAPSWMGEPTTRRGRQLYGIESDVSPIRLLRQGGDTSQPASGARSRRIRGVRARSAIRHTARYEGASGLSIPGSGPEYPARGRRAEHATRRSDGAAHCAPPTAVTRCRRGPPARQACRADPTPSAAGSGPKCASLCHLPPSPLCIRGLPATQFDHATSAYRVGE